MAVCVFGVLLKTIDIEKLQLFSMNLCIILIVSNFFCGDQGTGINIPSDPRSDYEIYSPHDGVSEKNINQGT